MAATSTHQGRIKGVAAVGAAVLAHAALLAPLALGALGLEFKGSEPDHEPTVLIQLEPRPRVAPRPVLPIPDRAPVASGPSFGPSLSSGPSKAGPRPPRPPSVEEATAIDSHWRVRLSIQRQGWGDCPEAFNQPSAQRLCNERDRMRLAAAASRASQALPSVSVPPSVADPSGDFARTAAANQAWRDYTRNDGPYPGLRSLLRDH